MGETEKIRVAHFSAVTHAPALIGRAEGIFEKAFQGEAEIEWRVFNAGPLAIESLFADELDLLYIGPNPAINGFVRSGGEALRIIAGVSGGGSAFVVQRDAEIQRFEDLRGKRVAIPQIGNSQDVALRYLMKKSGLKPHSEGGDVEIFRLGGGDQIRALAKGDVQGVWTVEPWVSRLVGEAEGRILFEEKDLWPQGRYATALLVVRQEFLEAHPDWVERWLKTHLEVIQWMQEHPKEAKEILNGELERETGHGLTPAYLNECFERITFTEDPMEEAVRVSAVRAFEIGFLGRKPISLDSLFDLSLLEKVKKV